MGDRYIRGRREQPQSNVTSVRYQVGKFANCCNVSELAKHNQQLRQRSIWRLHRFLARLHLRPQART